MRQNEEISSREFTVRMLYERYGSLLINRKQLAEVMNISFSAINKIFHEHKERVLLPNYQKIGGKTLWKIDDVVDFLENTEIV